jgi:hypothetical protein
LRQASRALLTGHVLFDLVIDERLAEQTLRGYRAALIFDLGHLSDAQKRILAGYIGTGGVLVMPQTSPAPAGELRFVRLGPEMTILEKAGPQGLAASDGSDGSDGVPGRTKQETLPDSLRRATNGELSCFDAPWTVQVQADHQPWERRLLVHFVNYNRDESQPNKELPIAAEPVGVDLQMPGGLEAKRIRFLTPEVSAAQRLTFDQTGRRLRFRTPAFLVYGFAAVDYR